MISNTSNRQVSVFDSSASLSAFTCSMIADKSEHSIAEHGFFSIALSGGSQPQLLHSLTSEPLVSRIEWSKWHVFWVDERCVALEHDDSNYRLARQHLLQHVPIPESNVHHIDASLSPADAALHYQQSLCSALQTAHQQAEPLDMQHIALDLVLLGIGEDGHTASLFPQHAGLHVSDRLVFAVTDSPKPPPSRITFSLPLINRSRYVAFLATGSGKAAAIRSAFDGEQPLLPIARVRAPVVHWILDNAAASYLRESDLATQQLASL
jgi:6-phosphogluconolactonase